MKKLTLITIGLSLLFAFAGCSDSNNILSPTDELSLDAVKDAGTLSKPSAQQTVTLQLQSIGGATQWRLQAKLTSKDNGQFRGNGVFEIPVLGGVIMIPVLGVIKTGGIEIKLRARGQEPGAGRVRLRFNGSGTQDPETGVISGTGGVSGTFVQAGGATFDLDGPSSFVIDNRPERDETL